MPRKKMLDFRIDEVSGVDVPAQQGATVTIMKRATPEQSVQKYHTAAMTGESDGHQHGIEVHKTWCDCGCTTLSVEYSSDTNGNSHTYPITQSPLAIGASIGHGHEIDGATLMKMAKEHDMPNKPETTTAEPTIEGLQTENQRLAAIVGLSTEERAHFDALPEGMRDTFLGKSADERRAEIVAKNDADPVVYTTSDGVEIRKSDGAAMLAISKRADAVFKRRLPRTRGDSPSTHHGSA